MDAPQKTNVAETRYLGMSHETACAIGERLRESREAKSKTHKQIASKIRVKESYLVTMEQGDWDQLPPGVNGRGFIRLYAKELGVALPEFEEFSQGKTTYQILAEDYEKLVEVKDKKETKKKTPKANKSVEKKSVTEEKTPKARLVIDDVNSQVLVVDQEASKIAVVDEINREFKIPDQADFNPRFDLKEKLRLHAKKAIFVGLFAVVCYGVYTFLNSKKDLNQIVQSYDLIKGKVESTLEKTERVTPVPEQPIAPTTENLNPMPEEPKPAEPQLNAEAAAQASDTAPVGTQPPPATPTMPVEQTASASTPPIASGASVPATDVLAKLEVLSQVELKILIDGQSVFSGQHEAGSVELPFSKTAEISIADGSKIRLSYNGWDLGVLGTKGRKRKIILNAENFE